MLVIKLFNSFMFQV